MMRSRKTTGKMVASATVIVWSSCLLMMMLLLLPSSSLAQDQDETKAGDSRNWCSGECEPESCPAAEGCKAGFTLDPCGCCTVCAPSLGDKCDYYNNNNSEEDEDEATKNVDRAIQESSSSSRFGDCGDNLECRLRDDNRSPGDREATCQCTDQRIVCGSDGKTYDNICQLREESVVVGLQDSSFSINEDVDKSSNKQQQQQQHPLLTVAQWGPCEEGKYTLQWGTILSPSITSSPEPQVRVGQHGNAALACEARGWPVPTITWETVRADGSHFVLPSDHTTIAVQQRGGPERLMVSGWVQVMSVQPHDGGRYTCVATNKLGEARAESQLGVYEGKYERYPICPQNSGGARGRLIDSPAIIVVGCQQQPSVAVSLFAAVAAPDDAVVGCMLQTTTTTTTNRKHQVAL
ncbi:unnamed protein product [Notodromas monacha]|uniref:Uncharacterized protein n=1 Tax=Notodromas monacha TaxID=399045 RepID=A0A7R9BR72_9CRUS|nr:unnamed protein product [Notodromas monacha]CAG0918830.1 unnamed protein product [Notodromas monacha]